MLRAIALLFLILALASPALGGEPDDEDLARVVPALLGDLAADDYGTREAAFRKLRILGPRALPWLEKALESDDPEVVYLVRRLIDGARHRSESDLLAPLETNDNAFRDSEEFRAIVSRGRAILPAVLKVIDEEDLHYPRYSYYRLRNAYWVLAELVEPDDLELLLDRLDSENIQHRLLLGPIFKELAVAEKERVLGRAFAFLLDPGEPARARANLLDLLRSIAGNEARLKEIGVELLGDDQPRVRAAAVRYLSLQQDREEMLPHFVELAGDEDPAVRVAALRALRLVRGESVRGVLVKALRDPVPEVRAAALEVLRDTAGPDMAPTIRPFLKDPDARVRATAAQALARFGDRSAVPALIESLSFRDEEFLTRNLHSVVDALGRLGDPSALGPLLELFEDSASDDRIRSYRHSILAAIVKVGGVKCLDLAARYLRDPEFRSRHIVLDAVAGIDSDEVVPILEAALASGDGALKRSAVRGLSQRRLATAAPLIHAAMKDEEDVWFLAEAATALTSFGYEKAVPDLVKLLNSGDPKDTRRSGLYYSLMEAMLRFQVAEAAPRIAELALAQPHFRYRAADALGRLGNREVVPALVKLLEVEKRDYLRHRIALALARLGEKGPLTERLAEIPPESSQYVGALLALGRIEDAEMRLRARLAERHDDPSLLYDLGCVLALKGDLDRAFAAIGAALEKRRFTRRHLQADPDLAPLRKDPRWPKLLEKAK